jgi:hypothetical protein
MRLYEPLICGNQHEGRLSAPGRRLGGASIGRLIDLEPGPRAHLGSFPSCPNPVIAQAEHRRSVGGRLGEKPS